MCGGGLLKGWGGGGPGPAWMAGGGRDMSYWGWDWV